MPVACNESDWQKMWSTMSGGSSYIKYGEISAQRIKYEILNDETSLFNTLEYSAAIFTVGEDFTSILEKVL